MAITLIKTFAILILGLMLWPIIYSVWLSFSASDFMEPPIGDWSLQWYRQFFFDPRWVSSLAMSAKVAALSVFLSLFMALTLATYDAEYGMSRLARGLIILPFLVPPVVLAMGLLPWLHQIGLWGHILSLSLAHALLIFPVVFLILRDGLKHQSKALAEAARSLGANALQVYGHITIPLLFPWLVVSALIAAVISLNEFIIAQFLSTPELETLPTVIWPSLRYTLTPVIASASSISLASTVTLLGFAAILVRYIRTSKIPNQ